ncbi:MAG: LysO family transporter [Bacteroidales bacterium]|nr:LysO family transporter [Bacteroidales bacterium]
MWIILILLCLGTIAGFIFSKVKGFNRLSEKAGSWSVYLLLFSMGLSVGTKPEIMRNLSDIGFSAFLLSIFAIAGSVLLSFLLYHYVFRKNEK